MKGRGTMKGQYAWEWTATAGLSPDGGALARAVLPHMLAALAAAGGDYEVALAALREAHFRADELPRRTAAFQRSYLAAQKDNVT